MWWFTFSKTNQIFIGRVNNDLLLFIYFYLTNKRFKRIIFPLDECVNYPYSNLLAGANIENSVS